MGISIPVSTLSSFGSCRRRWVWGETYRPLKDPVPLVFGRIIHTLLDMYYTSLSQGNSGSSARAQTLETLGPVIESHVTESNVSIDVLDSELIEGMFHNYTLFDSDHPLPGDVLWLERKVKYRVPGTRSSSLSGRLDLVLQTDAGYYIVDHKTASTAPNMAGFEVDEQLTGYCWLFWKETGIFPKGVVFNVLYKTMPTEPVVLKSGQLSRDKSQSTTHGLFLSALIDRGLDIEEYRGILNHLAHQGWNKFFYRNVSSRSETEIRSFEKRLTFKAREIASALSHPQEAYPSPSIYTCFGCPFLGVCKIKDQGGDYQSILDLEFRKY